MEKYFIFENKETLWKRLNVNITSNKNSAITSDPKA